MKKIITLIYFTCTLSLFAQNVNILDDDFKKHLIEKGVDTNKDGKIQVSEAEAVEEIFVYLKQIKNFIGIEAFVNLKKFSFGEMNIDSLDVSKNVKLTHLTCNYNNISYLDLSKNIALTNIDLSNNVLKSLDVSKNIALKEFNCSGSNFLKTVCVNPIHEKSTWVKDDNIEYSTNCVISFIETKKQINSKIIKVYNLQGVEVPINTIGQLIILYDNGYTQKIFNN